LLALMRVRVLLEPSFFVRPRRLARPRTPPFHGDNMGSNPIGDTNQSNNLRSIPDAQSRSRTADKLEIRTLRLVA
jgi:hypothetical protein